MISCILPVYNGARHVAEAIDSVLAQTWGTVELVVIDDGSTDSTPEVVARYGSRLRYLRHAKAGVAATRNRGVEAVRGDFVGFIDHDDVWTRDKLVLQMAALEQNPQLDFVTGMVEHFGAEVRGSRFERPVPGYVMGATLLRRSLLQRVGPFRLQKHSSESEWLLRMRSQGTSELCLDAVVYRRRLRPDSTSHTDARRSVEAHLHMLKQHLDRKRGLTG